MQQNGTGQAAGARTVVVTGSTRGIGFGLARAFAASGCNVVVSGRGAEAVERALEALRRECAGAGLLGRTCDVRDPAALQALWDAATARFGRVDVWINNAGIMNPRRNLAALEPADIDAVLDVNLRGLVHATRIALRGMLEQGGGQIYNFEGFGSDGMSAPGLTLYGATKRAVAYFTRSLEKEYRGGPVQIGTISPGIVLTDLVLAPEVQGDAGQVERARRMYAILADRVEVVAPWLAARVLENRVHGARIRWLTPGKALGRFLLQPLRRRDPFADAGASIDR